MVTSQLEDSRRNGEIHGMDDGKRRERQRESVCLSRVIVHLSIDVGIIVILLPNDSWRGKWLLQGLSTPH